MAMCTTLLFAVLALVTTVSAQTVAPSNNTNDIPPYENYPRFWVNSTDFPSFEVVPLGWYGQITQQYFRSISIDGRLTNVDASNANAVIANGISYISCDPKDYPGDLGANEVLRLAASTQGANSIVLYSTTANHCTVSSLRSIAPANGIFTTLDPATAAIVQANARNDSTGMPATINPDLNSFTNTSGGYGGSSQGQQGGTTTAVAMIILYTITGLITALFVVIIVTGAVRAHRHPERYGPRSSVAGRPRRSRAKGIARAMLDTIPIVKFGEKDETQKKEVDVEMTNQGESDHDKSKTTSADATEPEKDSIASGAVTAVNADGTDETGTLGCSICTEDFTKGEEVRLLPCNHKFHPECVDPWLLNVSGTCPLCRIDLRPQEERDQSPAEGDSTAPELAPNANIARREGLFEFLAPPLGRTPIRLDRDRMNNSTGRRDTVTFASLRSVAGGSREDRIAALRRFRQQRRNRGEETVTAEQEEERRSLSTRMRERFRIRTRRLGDEEGAASVGHTTNSGASAPGPSVTREPVESNTENRNASS